MIDITNVRSSTQITCDETVFIAAERQGTDAGYSNHPLAEHESILLVVLPFVLHNHCGGPKRYIQSI